MSSETKPSSAIVWVLIVAVGLLLALVTGRLSPHMVPDSASYLDYPWGSLEAACRSQRMPGYPLWLMVIQMTFGIAMVPAAQVLVHATAAWWLQLELGHWKLPRAQRLAVAIAVGVGCTAMDHISTLSTDAIAASLGVMAATATLRAVRRSDRMWDWVGVALLSTTAIFLRPAYLFLIPWLLVATPMLRRVAGTSWRRAWMSGVPVAAAVLLPVFGWACLRYSVVGDFGILPFGHQNLAGVLVQLVSDDQLRDIDGDPNALATEVVKQKHQFQSTGDGFTAGVPGATMTIDARWDDMTYHVVIPAARRLVGDDSVRQHREIAGLNKAIILRWPGRYALWILKAARRGAWAIAADIVMHPLFLVAISVAVLLILYRSLVPVEHHEVVCASRALRALTVVTFTYMILKVGLVILSSPPIGRFSDAAAIFLPAWLAAVFLNWWQHQA